MRVGPIATLLEPSEVLLWVTEVSCTTTTNPIAQAGAAMFALRANTLSRGTPEPTETEIGLDRMSPEFIEAWRKLERACEVMAVRGEEGLLEYATKTGMSNKALHEAANGFALTGIPWVLGCVDQASSFADALLRVCSSGGDTDTVAAMAGCLAALRFGRSDIPAWMFNGLVGQDHLLDPTLWHPVGTERQYAEMDTQVLLAAEQRVRQLHASRKRK
jgi:ADP-ribosylglycohydrolase